MTNILLFIHILCGAIWLGGGAINTVILTSTKRLNTSQAKPILQTISNLGKFVFSPTSMLVFISGMGLISVAGWGFGELWISLAFTGFILNIILGVVFHPRAGRSALKAIEASDYGALKVSIQNWLYVSYIDLVIIISVLALMVFKPGA